MTPSLNDLPPDQTILVAGGHGMVGKALIRLLKARGCSYILAPFRDEIDLMDQRLTFEYFQKTKPDVVVVAAAKVGGILANQTYPASFLYENLMIACNCIHAAHLAGVDRLLYLGSTCIYPKGAPQPIPEEALLSGPLEPTNEAYALAKISGIKLCQAYARQFGRRYIAAMPTNLYGPGDTYHPENSHVIPCLIQRFHEAAATGKPEVIVWGKGEAKREFLHVNDLVKALVLLLEKYESPEPINIGSDEEVTIQELAKMIAEVVGYSGIIVQDRTKPDGPLRKKTDSSKINAMGWRPKIGLREGLSMTYENYRDYLCCKRPDLIEQPSEFWH